MINRDALLLYAVTDRAWLKPDETLADAVRAALEGGVTLVQLRDKHADRETLIQSALEIKEICHAFQVPLIINDRIDVCLAADADGVHLGQGDTPIGEARIRLGDNKIIGITARTPEQAIAAEKGGADYLGSGAIFGTFTKNDAKKMEPETLRAITASVHIPVAAIGGIKSANVDQLAGLGISGAAVVSGIFAQPDICAAAQELKKKLQKIVMGTGKE